MAQMGVDCERVLQHASVRVPHADADTPAEETGTKEVAKWAKRYLSKMEQTLYSLPVELSIQRKCEDRGGEARGRGERNRYIHSCSQSRPRFASVRQSRWLSSSESTSRSTFLYLE